MIKSRNLVMIKILIDGVTQSYLDKDIWMSHKNAVEGIAVGERILILLSPIG